MRLVPFRFRTEEAPMTMMSSARTLAAPLKVHAPEVTFKSADVPAWVTPPVTCQAVVASAPARASALLVLCVRRAAYVIVAPPVPWAERVDDADVEIGRFVD